MQYLLRAVDSAQSMQTLRVEAPNEAAARAQAEARQLTVLSARSGWRLTAQGEAPFPLLVFAQQLQSLLRAGLGVTEALEALADQEAGSLQGQVIVLLLQDLRDGLRLSAALRRQPAAFPDLFAGMVQAAEDSSGVDVALERFVRYEGRLRGVRHKIASAAVYPVILLGVAGLVFAFLLLYVVPRFAIVYQGSGREVPWASQLLLAWGVFAASHVQELAGVILAAIAAVAGTLLRGDAQWRDWLQLARRVPGLGARLKTLELARMYLTLGTLNEGGIPLVRAMRMAGSVVQTETSSALMEAGDLVNEGTSLSTALHRLELLTPVTRKLLQAGEQGGCVGPMLLQAAQYHDEDIARWFERFSKAFEPLLMAAIGLVIGLVVVLLYLPVFELAGSLQ